MKRENGFSMIEVLVVIGIFIIVAGFGLTFTINSLVRGQLRNERTSIVSLLMEARNEAMNNKFEKAHGIHIDATPLEYVSFQGSTYNSSDPTNEMTMGGTGVSVALPGGASSANIIFNQLSGDSNFNNSFTISNDVESFVLSVNSKGQINW